MVICEKCKKVKSDTDKFYSIGFTEQLCSKCFDEVFDNTNVVSTPSNKIGIRHNQDKTRLELIPPEFIEEVGKVFTFGAKKYAKDNWKLLDKEQQEQIVGSLLRHILEYQKGNKLDSESGLSHLAHASCNLAMMIWFDKQKETGE